MDYVIVAFAFAAPSLYHFALRLRCHFLLRAFFLFFYAFYLILELLLHFFSSVSSFFISQ